MTLTKIEKAAKLMGYKIVPHVRKPDMVLICKPGNENSHSDWFLPYTNKADLMDVECALGIDVEWNEAAEYVHAVKNILYPEYLAQFEKYEYFTNHPTKFAARAEAVIAVAVQIYDRRELCI